MHRVTTIAVTAASAVLLLAAPAVAHVGVSPSEAPAGFARLALSVPHGCDGAATERFEVQIPTGVVSVKPEQVPGWDAATETGPYDEPVDLHGEEITEGVQVVTWTAQPGNELPDDLFREFGLSVRLPDEPGELTFPSVQGCVDGSELAWIELDPDSDHPAPTFTVTAGGGDHGGHGSDDGDAAADDTGHDVDETTVTDAAEDITTAAVAAEADDGVDPLAVTALVIALLAAMAGGAAFATARREH